MYAYTITYIQYIYICESIFMDTQPLEISVAFHWIPMPGERLPAGWASADGMGGSGEVDTLKNQLREAWDT